MAFYAKHLVIVAMIISHSSTEQILGTDGLDPADADPNPGFDLSRTVPSGWQK